MPSTTDKRQLRGSKSRGLVLDRAVDVASLHGLDGLSFGGLASDVGLSKAGVQTLFGSKEALQLAVIDHARTLFVDAVVVPTLPVPRGLRRLDALVDRWVVYAETPLFEGGCFRVANLAAFDSRGGPLHDALFGDQEEWVGLIADEVRHAVAQHETGDLDVEGTAFALDAVLCATNTALRSGDAQAVLRMRRIVERLTRRPA